MAIVVLSKSLVGKDEKYAEESCDVEKSVASKEGQFTVVGFEGSDCRGSLSHVTYFSTAWATATVTTKSVNLSSFAFVNGTSGRSDSQILAAWFIKLQGNGAKAIL